MTSSIALLLLGMAFPSDSAGTDRAEVFVIERTARVMTYSLRGQAVNTREPLTGIRKVLGDIHPAETRIFVLVGEGVPIDQAYLVGSVFGKIGTFKEIRYFHFARTSGIMMEFKLLPERWRLSFEGALVRTDR
jgi:hypothetical protein